MRFTRKTMIAGAIAVTLAGAAYAADQAKVMTVTLPDGCVEKIEYRGDAAPKVVLAQAPMIVAQPADLFAAAFGADSMFAHMDRIHAQMMAQQEAMMRQAAAMQQQAVQAQANGVSMASTGASTGTAPAGSSFTYISTSTTENGCTHTIQISSNQGDKTPMVHKTIAGDCTAAKAGATPAIETAPAAQPAPVIKPVSAPKPVVKVVPSNTI